MRIELMRIGDSLLLEALPPNEFHAEEWTW
jgi:hypothetical protein